MFDHTLFNVRFVQTKTSSFHMPFMYYNYYVFQEEDLDLSVVSNVIRVFITDISHSYNFEYVYTKFQYLPISLFPDSSVISISKPVCLCTVSNVLCFALWLFPCH